MRVAQNDSDDRVGLGGYVQLNKYTYIQTYINTYIHTYMHTYIHTNIHTRLIRRFRNKYH